MQKYILPLCGSMRLTEFSPKVVAAFYGELQKQPNMTTHILAAIQKLLHSAFEQAVLWEYVNRNPFHKAEIPEPFSSKLPLLSKEEMKKLLQNSGFFHAGDCGPSCLCRFSAKGRNFGADMGRYRFFQSHGFHQ